METWRWFTAGYQSGWGGRAGVISWDVLAFDRRVRTTSLAVMAPCANLSEGATWSELIKLAGHYPSGGEARPESVQKDRMLEFTGHCANWGWHIGVAGHTLGDGPQLLHADDSGLSGWTAVSGSLLSTGLNLSTSSGPPTPPPIPPGCTGCVVVAPTQLPPRGPLNESHRWHEPLLTNFSLFSNQIRCFCPSTGNTHGDNHKVSFCHCILSPFPQPSHIPALIPCCVSLILCPSIPSPYCLPLSEDLTPSAFHLSQSDYNPRCNPLHSSQKSFATNCFGVTLPFKLWWTHRLFCQ